MSIKSALAWVVVAMVVLTGHGVVDAQSEKKAYEVDFLMSDPVDVKALTVEVRYKDLPGRFVLGSDGKPLCTPNPKFGGYVAFGFCEPSIVQECDNGPVLSAAVISVTPFRGPISLFTCAFEGNGDRPSTTQFDVYVREAADLEGRRVIERNPTVAATRVVDSAH